MIPSKREEDKNTHTKMARQNNANGVTTQLVWEIHDPTSKDIEDNYQQIEVEITFFCHLKSTYTYAKAPVC